MKTTLVFLLLSVVALRGDTPTQQRILSADGRSVAVVSQDYVTLMNQRGQVLSSTDYRDRDYRPERGRWSHSSRFYVYALSSQGGHSPWHRPFVVVDARTGHTYSDDDLQEGMAVTEFRLSSRDTLSYQVLDGSKEDWGASVPGLPRRFSLAQKVASLTPHP